MAKKSSVAIKSRKQAVGKPKALKKPRKENQVKVRQEPAAKTGSRPVKSHPIQLDIKHQLKVQKALYEIADAAGSAKDMGMFYKKLHKIVDKLMYAKNFYIAEYDHRGDLITWPYHADEKDVQEDTWVPQPLKNEKGMTAHVIRTGEIFYTSQDPTKAFRTKKFKVVGTLPEDAIVVPLRSNDAILGAVGVQIYTKEVTYSDQDVEVLTFVANHIATALTRARAIEETRRRNTELQIINSIQQGLAAELDFQSIVDLVGDKLRAVFNTPNLGIQWYEEEKNLLHIFYAYEQGKRLQADPRTPRDNGVFSRHLRSRKPVVLHNPEEYKKLNMAVLPGTERGKSFISVPIISGDRVLGNVDMENFDIENAFGESEIRLLTTITASLGTALENARLYQETKRRFKETENLRAANIALTQSLDLEDILGTLLDFLHKAIDYDTGSVFLLEGDSKLTSYAIHGFDKWAKDSASPIGASYEFKNLQHMRDVIEKQITVVIPDVTKHPHWIVAPAGKHIRNWLAIPLIIGGKTIGLYSLDKSIANYFTADHQRLAENLAAQAAIAIQNATLFKNQSVAREQAETLHAVTQALSSTLSLQEVFNKILTELQKVVPYDSCSVHQLEDGKSVIVGGRGFPNSNEVIGIRFKITSKNVGANVIKSRKPFIVDDVSADYPDFRKPEHGGGRIHGWLGVPLIFGDRLIGMLALDKYEKSFYTPEHATLALAFAAQAAVAIENARLFETEHKAREQAETNARQLSAINRVAQAASSTLDLKSVLEIFAQEMADLVNAKSVGIGLLNDDQTEIKVVAYHSLGGGGDVVGEIIPLKGNHATQQVIETGKAVLIKDPQNTPLHNEATRALMRSLNIQCILIAPILSRGKVIGTIGHDLDEPNRVFTSDEVNLAQTVANQLSGVIENVRLFDEAQRLLKETEVRNQELSIINNLQELLASKLDIQAIYELIGEKLCKVFDVDVIDIVLYDSSTNLITMPYSFEKGDRSVIDPREPYGFRKHVLKTRKPLLINRDFEENARQYNNPLITGEWPKAALFVPLITEGKAIGVISIQDLDKDDSFSDSDLRLLQTLANAISVALENARLFDEVQKKNIEITEALERETASTDILQVIAESPTNLQPVLDAIARNAAQLSGSDDAIIGLADNNLLKVDAHFGDIPMIPVGDGIPLNRESVAGRAILEGKPRQAIHNQQGVKSEYPEGDRVAKKYGYRMTCSIPLKREGKTIGVISIRRTRPELLTNKQVTLVQSFAKQAAIAISNVRLFEAEQQRVAELQIINSIQLGLASKLDINSIIKLIGDEIKKIFVKTDVEISLYNAETKMINFPYWWSTKEGLIFAEPLPLGRGLHSKLIESKKPLLLDTAEEVESFGAVMPKGYPMRKSFLGVPIISGINVLGCISLHDPLKENRFDKSDQRLLTTLANSMSVALENARLFDETQRLLKETEQRNAELAIVNSIQLGLASKLDMQAIFELVGEKIRGIFDAQVTVIATYEHESEQAHYRYISELGKRYDGKILPFNGFHKQMIRGRKTILFNNDLAKQVGKLGLTESFTPNDLPKSALNVPLFAGKKVIGHVALENLDHEYAFTTSDVRLLETLANSMSVALESARLFDETQRLLKETEERNAEMEALRSATVGLTSSLNLNDVLNSILESIFKLFENVNTIDIFLYDQDKDDISFGASFNKDKGKTDQPIYQPRRNGLTFTVIREGETIIISDRRQHELYKHMSNNKGAIIGMPLKIGKQVVGVLNFSFDEVRTFEGEALRILHLMADQAAVAIGNARLFDETQRLLKVTEERNAELAIINSVQGALAENLDIRGIYEIIGEKIREIFNAQAVILSSYDLQENSRLIHYMVEKGERFHPEPGELNELAMNIINQRKTLVFNQNADVQLEKLGAATIPGSEKVKSAVFVPLLAGNRVFGAISLQNVDRENTFTESDVRLLQTLANSMSVALENARLFDETQRLLKETEQRNSELAIITDIQRGLVAELDTKAMYNLVGERIHERYPEQAVVLSSYDHVKRVTNYHYAIENNQRLQPEPTPFSYVTEQLLNTRRHLLVNNNVSSLQEKGVKVIKGTKQSSSVLFTPLVAGDQVRGVIQVADNDRENFFSESDTRLMNTLAASLSVALENARLFEETQRLLKETEQRNAELAMINAVQQALVSNLDIKAIYKSVGRKLTEIFQVQSAAIYTINTDTRMMAYEYAYESGKEWDIGSKPTTTLHDYIIDHVLKTRKSFIVNTDFDKFAASHPDYTSARGQMPKSMCAVPIVIQNNNVTGISLQNLEEENYFGSTAMRLLETIANAVSIAIENARLFDETQQLLKVTEKNAEELKIINRVGEDMSRRLDAKTITRTVGDSVTRIFQADATSILMLDEQNYLILPVYEYDEGNYVENIEPFKLGKGLTSHVINTRKALILGSSDEAKEYGVYYPPEAIAANPNVTQSYLGVPIISGERVIGVISVNTYTKNAYTEDSVRLLSTLANNMGVALENANLFDETQQLLKVTEQRASELSAISTVSQALVAETELDSLIQLIGEQMRVIFNADIAYLALLDQSQKMINFPYQYGDNFPSLKLGEGLTSTILKTGEPLRLNQNMDEESQALGVHRVGRRALSYLGVPIKSGKETIGVLSVQSMTEEEIFDEDDLRLLTTIAANAGAAINTAQLHAETLRRAKEMATLAEIGNDIAASRELEPVLERIASHVKDILKVRDVAIYLREGEELHASVAGIYTKEIKAQVLKMGYGLSGNIAQSGVAELVNYPSQDPRTTHITGTPEEDDDREAMMVAPLTSRGEVIGVLTVWRLHENGLFTQPDLDFLISVARQTSIAVESARLYLETQRRAREMSALVDVGRDISSSLDAQTVLESIAHHALELLDGDLSALFLPEGDGNTFRAIAAVGEESEELRNDTIKLGEGLLGSIALSKVGEIVNDSNADPRTVLIKGTEEMPDEHLIAVPLLANNELKGLMSVWRHGKEKEFAENELEFMQNLARQAVIAVQNAQFFAETQRLLRETEEHAAELSIINSVGQTMTQEIDLQTMIDSVGDKLREAINVENIGIGLYEAGANVLHAPYVLRNGKQLRIGPSKLNNFNLRMAKMGRSLVLNSNVEKHWQKIGSNLTVGDVVPKSFMMIPMLAGKELVGGITIQDFEHENAYSESFVRLIETIAANMGTAVQNARLFDEVTRRKEFFEVLFQNNPVAVVTIDNDANVTSWNPAAEFLFGYSQEEAIGKNVDSLVANRDDLYEEAMVYSEAGLTVTENAFQVIAKRTRKDGTLVDVELSGVPIMVQGKKLGMYALYHDITELERAREEAIAANEAKSAFLATMSHEIRTPMNAVIGMSGLLMDTPLNKEQQEYTETIRNSGDTLLAIINDILDFSKIEAGKMEVESQPFDLRDCVESALDLTSGRAIEKGLDIAYMIDDDVPSFVKSDVTRLRQILINLLSNAIKFTGKGEVVLSVKKGKARNDVQFTVTDTGIGISENHMRRLFQSFSQADSSTTRRFGGTGLGLAISKRLAEIMGGTMYAESDGLGRGSRFIFTINAEPAVITEKKAERDIKGIQSILKGKTVLIVDDNATNRRILMLQTTKWGMIAQETEFPREALQWIKDGNKYDIMITDMHMPELDGLMLTREIRKIADEKTLPVILLTSLGRRELGADEVHFSAYLNKPLKPSALYDTLTGLFIKDRSAARNEPITSPTKTLLDPELASRHPLRILLAEDNTINQKLALRILEQMGYRADVASNGIEAVESIERQIYDVVLMDVQMPEMDGLDATRTIRKFKDRIQPHIIAMTANAMEGDREMCIAAGMNDYVSKPIRVNELIDALMKAEKK